MPSQSNLSVQRCGKKSAPTLVLLHGFLAASGYWVPVQTELRDQFDIVAVDLPGFGGSAGVPAPDSIQGVAREVVHCLDQLQIDRFSLLGFSMGGMVAQQIALDYGRRIERLVLYGTAAAGDLPDRFEPWDASIARMESLGVESMADKSVASWFVDGIAHPFYPICREASRGASQTSCVKLMRAMQRWNVVDRLGEINIPTLVIVGDKDKSTKPAEAIRIWQNIPEAQLCMVPGCAHGVHMEKPSVFNRVVLDFLNRSSVSASQ